MFSNPGFEMLKKIAEMVPEDVTLVSAPGWQTRNWCSFMGPKRKAINGLCLDSTYVDSGIS